MLRKLKELFNAAVQPTRGTLKSAKLGWDAVKNDVPQGDGHLVLFLPGMLGDDSVFDEMRRCAEEKGHKTHGWEKGKNFGFNAKTGQHLQKLLKKVYDKNGGKKVTIVGHSLGGVFARELAREYPEMVRNVVTIGSPFNVTEDMNAGTSRVLRTIHDFFNPGKPGAPAIDGSEPLPMPASSLYSKADGIVNWRTSLNKAAPAAENIEVEDGHAAMVFNAKTLVAVLDRIAQPEGSWKPFDATAYSKVFPTPPQKPAAGKEPPHV